MMAMGTERIIEVGEDINSECDPIVEVKLLLDGSFQRYWRRDAELGMSSVQLKKRDRAAWDAATVRGCDR